MGEPLVSVKMITYNHAPYIAQAIECVLNQKTNFPFELVVGEDCSTDETREIVFEYQKKYPHIIRVITSEQNVGMKKNGYRTFKACRGKYIAICEGDDYWHNHRKLQLQVDYMESHPACGMVHSNHDVYQVSSGKLIKDYIKYRKFVMPEKPNMIDIIINCRESFRIQTCTVMVQRTLYEQIVNSDPYLHQSNHFLMGDTQLWAEMAAISEIGYIPDSLATYRLVDNSASRGMDNRNYWRFERSHSEMLLYLCYKHKLPENIRRKRELAFYDHSLRLALHERNSGLAFEVKKNKHPFTLADWLRYYGARYLVIYYICRVAALIHNLFRYKPVK